MSIASEIERIQNAKTSIKTAIESKGVVVGSGTIDTYPSKINEIIVGGGDTTAEDGIIERTITGSYTNNRITKIGENAFRGSTISEFNSTSATAILGYAFYYVTTLENINVPNVIGVSGAGMFTNCSKLQKIYFPNNNGGIGNAFCRNCTSLEYVNVGNCSYISTEAFRSCTNLKYIIIPRTSAVPSLSSTNAFQDSGITNGTGFIYVGDNLYESYLTATNWSTYANQIKKLSELPEGVEL